LFGLLLALGLFVMIAQTVPPTMAASRQQLIETPEPTAMPTSTPAPTQNIVQNVFHILSFPFETMTEAVVQMSNKIVLASYEAAGQHFTRALDVLITGPFGLAPEGAGADSTPLFRELIWPHWQVTIALAVALLPATLMLTTVSALRAGAASVLGYVEVKEALLGWVISAGAAATSYYLLSLAHRLSVAAATSVLQADFGEQVSGGTIAGAFFNATALLALSTNALASPLVLYLAFLALFLASTVMLGLGLALAAYLALTYLLTTIAPVVLVLGALPPLRWLNALWLKSVTAIFLVPVIDALLLKAAASLFYSLLNAQGAGEMGTFISGLFITAGVISVLITLNFKVGEGLFGALAEVHRQAGEATASVMQMATMATGLALGSPAMSGLALGGGGGVSGGSSAPGFGPRPRDPSATATTPEAPAHEPLTRVHFGAGLADSAQAWMARFGRAQTPDSSEPANHAAHDSDPGVQVDPRVSGEAPSHTSEPVSPEAQITRARLAERVGRALAVGTRNPLLRGFGAGLQLGGMAGGYQAERALKDQLSSLPSPEHPGDVGPDQPSTADLASAALWSQQDLSRLPPEVFEPGRDNTGLMAGSLHQAFAQTGRALPLADALHIARATYGTWRDQGRPGGPEAERAMLATMRDADNKTSPATFIGAFDALAGQHRITLDVSFVQAVQAAFGRSHAMSAVSESGRRSPASS
jgi:hypothetical protein